MDPLAFVFGNLVSPAPNTLTQEDRDGKAKAHASLPPRSAAAPAQDCDLPFDLDLDRLLQSTAAAVTVSPWTPTPSTCSTSTTTTSNSAGKDTAKGKSKSKSRNKNKWLCLANSFSNPSHNMTNSKNQQGQGQGQGHEQEQEQEREWDPILTAFLNDSALAQLPSISTCASSSPAVNANNLDLYLGLDPLGLDAIDAMDASVAASAGSSNTLNINGLFPPSPPHSVMSGSLSPQRNTDLDTPSPLAHPAVPPTSSPPPLTGGGVGDHNLAPSLPLSSFPATGFSWPPFSTSPFSNPAAASTDPNASAAAAAAAAAAAMSMSMMFPPTSVFPPAWMPPPTGTTPLTPPAGTDFSSFPKLFPSFWPPSTNATPALPLTASSTSGTSSSATLLPSPAASTTASRSVSPPTSATSPTPGNTGKSASRSKPAVKTAPSQKRTSSQAGNSTPSSLSSSSPTPSSDLDPMDIVTDDLTPAAREAQALLTSRPKRRRRSAGQHSATFDDDLPTDTLMGGTLLPRPGSDADPSAPVSDAATTQPSNLTPEEKKRIRMMKNRLAASESRKRHREHLDTLESTTHQLVAENARLVAALRDSQAQCAELAGQVAKLTATLELAQQDSKVKSFGAVFALAMVGAAWLVPVMFTSPVPPGVGLVVRPGVRDPVQSGGSTWSAPVRGVKWNDGGQVLRTLGGKWHVGDPGAEIVPAAKHAGTLAGRVRAAARAVQWSITGKHAHEVPRLPEGPSSSAGSAAEAEATKVQQQDVRVQAKPWASGAVALIDAATAAGREQEDGVRPFVVVDGLVDEEDDVVEGPQVPVLQTLVNERADQ